MRQLCTDNVTSINSLPVCSELFPLVLSFHGKFCLHSLTWNPFIENSQNTIQCFLDILSKKRLWQFLCTTMFIRTNTRKTLTILRVTSLLSVGGKAEREVQTSSLWYPVTAQVAMAQSCTREGLDWTVGSVSILRGWPNIGTGFSGRWLMPQACLCLRGIWTKPLTTLFTLRSALNWSGSGTRWSF